MRQGQSAPTVNSIKQSKLYLGYEYLQRTVLMNAEFKITAGPWPFSMQNCQMANHFPKCMVLVANQNKKGAPTTQPKQIIQQTLILTLKGTEINLPEQRDSIMRNLLCSIM